MLTLQMKTLLTMGILCTSYLHMVYTMPTPGEVFNTSSRISTIVSQAIAELPTGDGARTVNATTLVETIVEGLTEGGIDECSGCKKQDEQYFLQQFTRYTQSTCLSLVKFPGNKSHSSSPPAYILTGNTGCLIPRRFRYSSSCFRDRNSTPKCTWNQTVKDFGEDTFPRFAVSVTCNGCKHSDRTCPTSCYTSELQVRVYVLKRQNECDSSGKEKWSPVTEVLTVGCSCLLQD